MLFCGLVKAEYKEALDNALKSGEESVLVSPAKKRRGRSTNMRQKGRRSTIQHSLSNSIQSVEQAEEPSHNGEDKKEAQNDPS